jgi:hypothetical protein
VQRETHTAIRRFPAVKGASKEVALLKEPFKFVLALPYLTWRPITYVFKGNYGQRPAPFCNLKRYRVLITRKTELSKHNSNVTICSRGTEIRNYKPNNQMKHFNIIN